MSPTAFHPSHISRLTGSDRSRLYQETPPPSGQTSPGHCFPFPLRTPSTYHADECKTLAYDDLLELSQRRVLIRVTISVCEILTLFSDLSISIFENIPVLYKHNKLGQRRHSRFCSKGGKRKPRPIVRRAHNTVR